MRILIATPFSGPDHGVLGLYAKGIHEGLVALSHTPRIVSLGKFERMLPPGVRHLAYAFHILPALVRSDAVFALDSWSVGFPALLLARLFRKHFSIRIGGDFLWESYVARTKEPILFSEFYRVPRAYSMKERFILRGIQFLVRHADALIFTTRFQRDIWQKEYTFDSSHIIENYFPPKADIVSPKGRIFVNAGRRIFLKNASALENAFVKVKARHPDITIDQRSLPHTEHLARLKTAYAVIIPTFSEVCSNTAIDAVADGKPFIMSEDTGTSERLLECGLFIDTRNSAALEKAIEALLDQATYERLAGAARSFSFTHSWKEIAEEYTAILV